MGDPDRYTKMNPEDFTPVDDLKEIKLIKSTYTSGDASMLLSFGGILIGISTFSKTEDDPEETGVRYHIGFDQDPSMLHSAVTNYGGCR